MKQRKGQALRRSLVLTHLQRSSTNHLGSFQLVALRWGTLHNLPQYQGGLPFPISHLWWWYIAIRTGVPCCWYLDIWDLPVDGNLHTMRWCFISTTFRCFIFAGHLSLEALLQCSPYNWWPVFL